MLLIAALVVSVFEVLGWVNLRPASAAPPATQTPQVLPQGGGPAQVAEELGDFSNPPYGAVDLPSSVPEGVAPAAIEGFDPATSVLLEQTEIEDIYQNADGSVSVQRHGDTVRVEQADGSFKDADPTLTTAATADLPPAAEDVAGVADQDAFVKSEEHPLAPVVGAQAESGMVSLQEAGASVRISPVDAPADSIAQQVSATEVSFPGASEGSDVIYEFTSGTVKESIIVTEAPGETGATSWSFWLDVEGASPVLTEDGAIELRKADGAVAMMLPLPYMFDSSGPKTVLRQGPLLICNVYRRAKVLGLRIKSSNQEEAATVGQDENLRSCCRRTHRSISRARCVSGESCMRLRLGSRKRDRHLPNPERQKSLILGNRWSRIARRHQRSHRFQVPQGKTPQVGASGMNPIFETILFCLWFPAIPAIWAYGPRTKVWKEGGSVVRGLLTTAWICLIVGFIIVHPTIRF